MRKLHKSEQIWAAIITGCFGVIVAVVALWKPKDEISLKPLINKEIRVTREVGHVKILGYRDKAKVKAPIESRVLNPLGIKSVASNNTSEDIYDMAQYSLIYLLDKHESDAMRLAFHSSGVCEPKAIFPIDNNQEISESPEPRHKTDLNLTLQLGTKEKGHSNLAIVQGMFYNAYQKKVSGVGYESDCALDVEFPTDELTLIVDFTAIDYANLVDGKVTFTYDISHTKTPDKFTPDIDNGIASYTVRSAPVGARLICDWKWKSE